MCAYVPPGYHENTLRRYSVLYMQDGQNLFFPDQAFMGQDFIHFAFPLQAHEEGAWARRIHLPMQPFWGKFVAARRGRAA